MGEAEEAEANDFSTPESEFIRLPSFPEHRHPVAGCALKHPKGPLLLMGGSSQLPLEIGSILMPAGGRTARCRLPSPETAATSVVAGVKKKSTGWDYCGKVAHCQSNCVPRAVVAEYGEGMEWGGIMGLRADLTCTRWWAVDSRTHVWSSM